MTENVIQLKHSCGRPKKYHNDDVLRIRFKIRYIFQKNQWTDYYQTRTHMDKQLFRKLKQVPKHETKQLHTGNIRIVCIK